MRTTARIDEDLLAQIRERARRENVSLDVRKALAATADLEHEETLRNTAARK
jgi:hypothetical protein